MGNKGKPHHHQHEPMSSGHDDISLVILDDVRDDDRCLLMVTTPSPSQSSSSLSSFTMASSTNTSTLLLAGEPISSINTATMVNNSDQSSRSSSSSCSCSSGTTCPNCCQYVPMEETLSTNRSSIDQILGLNFDSINIKPATASSKPLLLFSPSTSNHSNELNQNQQQKKIDASVEHHGCDDNVQDEINNNHNNNNTEHNLTSTSMMMIISSPTSSIDSKTKLATNLPTFLSRHSSNQQQQQQTKLSINGFKDNFQDSKYWINPLDTEATMTKFKHSVRLPITPEDYIEKYQIKTDWLERPPTSFPIKMNNNIINVKPAKNQPKNDQFDENKNHITDDDDPMKNINDINNNNINDVQKKNLDDGDDNFSSMSTCGSSTYQSSQDKPMERGQWSGKLDFIFSCISYAVGLGNVWRFPYLCYENGGGAFLVPYLICIFIIGVPLFLMEVSLGQYFHAGGVSIWNQIPVMKGVGFASMIMIGLCNTYYIVIIAWTLYYLFSSLKVPLPWMSCDNDWNTLECYMNQGKNVSHFTPEGSVSPAQEFWKLKALSISNDMAEVGNIQWHLFITLIIAWILVYAVIYKGIHQSGKIIWFMAMFPYVILTILFVYGISLPGAIDGIKFYITPKWHMLTEAKIWVAAGTQLLFTYGIGIGTNIALGSYNPTHHNFYRDSFIACLLSSFTSLFSGFVIFSVLGHMAFTMSKSVDDVARSGPGLAFIVYPEAVTGLPLPNLWSILFFTMLLVLGIDSQFCTVESFVTGIVDEWPRLLRPHRKLFTLFVVFVHFVLGISMITEGGMYVFQLMDNFSASGISLIVVVLFELLAFGWIYGGKQIYENMVEMLSFRPPRILYYLWCYISPMCLLGILTFSVVDYKPPEYAGRPFPWYGELFGWTIGMSSIIFIPTYMVYYCLFKADPKLSFFQRLATGFRPLEDDDDQTSKDKKMKKKKKKICMENNNGINHGLKEDQKQIV